MANIAGYKAIIESCSYYKSLLVGQMTAAGKSDPARIFIIGGGVAGLAALQTAVRLGAKVKCSDVRKEVKEQVESLYGQFVEISLSKSAEGEGGYAKALTSEDTIYQQEQ